VAISRDLLLWAAYMHSTFAAPSAISRLKTKAMVRKIPSGIGRTKEAGKARSGLTIDATFASTRGIVEAVKKAFHNSNVIDERIKQNFVDIVMPSAPPLTEQEKGVFKSLGGLEKKLEAEGKRIAGTVKSGVDKFLWTEDNNILGGFSCNVDISAEKMLADVYELSTYGRSGNHKKRYGDLPRLIRKNVDGSRSLHYTNGVSFPSPMQDRILYSWNSWMEDCGEDGKKIFVVGIVPLDRFQCTKERFEGADKFAKGETTAIYLHHRRDHADSMQVDSYPDC